MGKILQAAFLAVSSGTFRRFVAFGVGTGAIILNRKLGLDLSPQEQLEIVGTVTAYLAQSLTNTMHDRHVEAKSTILDSLKDPAALAAAILGSAKEASPTAEVVPAAPADVNPADAPAAKPTDPPAVLAARAAKARADAELQKVLGLVK